MFFDCQMLPNYFDLASSEVELYNTLVLPIYEDNITKRGFTQPLC
jgi:hypothetical protein